jgi:cytochrome c2
MPATEQTWRNQKTLHAVFAASALVMAVATVMMMASDHNREWKRWQLKDRKKDAWMTQSRRDSLAEQYAARIAGREEEIRKFDSQAVGPGSIEKFKARVREEQAAKNGSEADGEPPSTDDRSMVTPTAIETPSADANSSENDRQFKALDAAVEELREAAEKVDEAQKELDALIAEQPKPAETAPATEGAAEAEPTEEAAAQREQAARENQQALAAAREKLREAQDDAIKARRRVLGELNDFIRDARQVEKELVADKKSLNGVRTAKVSELGIKIGEGADKRAINNVQEEINRLDVKLADLTARIAAAKDYRTDLESVVAEIEAPKATAAKELETMDTELKLLEDQVYQNTSNVGEWVTRWPVLNALYSGNIRVEQNWLPDLTINYNFTQAARFDRCTTCHRAISKTAPRTATDPLYPTLPKEQRDITVALSTPQEAPAPSSTPEEYAQRLRQVYGFELAPGGIVDEAEVTVHYVLPETPAAKAGLQSGDAIRQVGDAQVYSPAEVSERLLTMVEWGKPVTLAIRRGLDHPFTAHPRLDLYLTDTSPHPVKDVGCTICHDGQGSGTSFPWTSHTPDNAGQQSAWAQDLGWFDNHHWIFPMKPARFVESNCLKCHHEKGSLEPSERFPEPPAPKLVEGWSTVEQYGCFGCHEINGYDSPTVTVGPDVRLEPAYYEAASQLLQSDKLTDEQRELAQTVRNAPTNADARHRLFASFGKKSDAEATDGEDPQPKTDADIQKLVSLLKDIEIPGEYRKVGPSLRFLNSKVEYDWLYSWIRRPRDFRESTKMPQFFLQYEHLNEEEDASELAESQKFEPIEIRALAEFLLNNSDKFEFEAPSQNVTEQPSAERGKWVFQSRGCLACHSHADFPEIKESQGPDLSRLSAKLNNEKGRQWLYSWVKQPNRYHVRTKMPDLFLDPIVEKDAQGQPTGKVTDPAADVVAYLLGVESDWRPTEVPARNEWSEADRKALAELAELWLTSDAIPAARARAYLQNGIPERLSPKLKSDERLLVGLNDDNRVARQLEFVARRTIGKYGCFGCHDIPGFEDGKPIGTALVDWGRKETSKLAFENIHKFLEMHSINPENPTHDARAMVGDDVKKDVPAAEGGAEGAVAGGDTGEPEHAVAHGHLDPGELSDKDSYCVQSLNSHGRDGFLWQKLRYPRSYDYKTTRNKNFNERLRMPRFNFTDQQREAVMTFVLGLVKEPPASKYLYKPKPRQKAIVEGRQVLERFNCAGCHTLQQQQWEFDYASDTFEDSAEVVDFPFLAPRFSEQEINDSKAKDYRGMQHGRLFGHPIYDEQTGEVTLVDESRAPVTPEDLEAAEAEGEPIPVFYRFQLWKNALINGQPRLRGVDELLIPAEAGKYGPANGEAHPAWGGDLARYLYPKVVAKAKETNPQVNAREAWGWLPPPLMDEGHKVQTDWLHGFLMDPYALRPAVVLRMPNFHMSSEEAAALVDYFAASSGAEFPYEYKPHQRENYLTQLSEQREDPLGEAMNIVTNGNYCVKCHAVADFMPQGDPNTFGPNLAGVYRRLRPEFTRDWIANPARILPYTGMPVNIPYRPDDPHMGGVAQDLYRGTSVEQLNGVVDLLMNFDAYTRGHTSVTPLVERAAAATAAQQQQTGQPDQGGAAAPPAGQPPSNAEGSGQPLPPQP